MKRVLVTGGAGFIGSHLCDELVARGYEVRVLDMLSAQVHGPDADPPAYLNPAVEFTCAPTTDEGVVNKVLAGVDVVVHLAAVVGVGQSMYELGDYVYFNSYGTAAMLDVLAHHEVKRLIVASSMSVYGEGAGACPDVEGCADEEHYAPVPTPETKPLSLSSIYALTKYDQERLCLLWGQAYNVPTIALRFFNVYGTRQSLSNPYTGVMAIFASRLLNNKPPIIFEDGQQSRDFVHVSDVVQGIVLALESEVSGEVFNIGSGQRTTILRVAEMLSTILTGDYVKPQITGQHRVGDIRHCFADISKAERLLGYTPYVKSLHNGIREYADWLKIQVAVDKLDTHVAELEQKGLLK